MVAFLAAVFFTLRALETNVHVEVAIAVASAGLGAAFAPRAALVAVVPAVGLAVGGRTATGARRCGGARNRARRRRRRGRHRPALDAVRTRRRGTPPGDTLASLSENFWSGRVLEWLAIAGVAGALRGRLRGRRDDRRRAARCVLLGAGASPSRSRGTSRCCSALLPVWPSVDARHRVDPAARPTPAAGGCPDSAADRAAVRQTPSHRGHATVRRRGHDRRAARRATTRADARREPIVASSAPRRRSPRAARRSWARVALGCLFVLIAIRRRVERRALSDHAGLRRAGAHHLRRRADPQRDDADGRRRRRVLRAAGVLRGRRSGDLDRRQGRARGPAPGRAVPQRRLRAPDGSAAAHPCAAALPAKARRVGGQRSPSSPCYPSSRRRRRCSTRRR